MRSFPKRSIFDRRCHFEPLEQRTLLSAAVQVPTPSVQPGDSYTAPQSNWFTPAQIRQAYGIDSLINGTPSLDGTGETIAIVDAYGDPCLVSRNSNGDVNQDTAFLASDLHQFDVEYNLPEPAGFFQKMDQRGGTNYPPATAHLDWQKEQALNVEWAHAIAPGAKIVLVESDPDPNSQDNTPNLIAAVDYAQPPQRRRGFDELGQLRVVLRQHHGALLRRPFSNAQRPCRRDVPRLCRRRRRDGREREFRLVPGVLAQRGGRRRDKFDRPGGTTRRKPAGASTRASHRTNGPARSAAAGSARTKASRPTSRALKSTAAARS